MDCKSLQVQIEAVNSLYNDPKESLKLLSMLVLTYFRQLDASASGLPNTERNLRMVVGAVEKP